MVTRRKDIFCSLNTLSQSGVTEGVRLVQSHCPREKTCPF